jgi:hypothetical protein
LKGSKGKENNEKEEDEGDSDEDDDDDDDTDSSLIKSIDTSELHPGKKYEGKKMKSKQKIQEK